ncbi:hypothetical protein CBM2626_A10119 [Cupriavidus taiwanensis]|nr:hypothetical protein CBM2626_A10119 [Cupriavidus taiwanensis]
MVSCLSTTHCFACCSLIAWLRTRQLASHMPSCLAFENATKSSASVMFDAFIVDGERRCSWKRNTRSLLRSSAGRHKGARTVTTQSRVLTRPKAPKSKRTSEALSQMNFFSSTPIVGGNNLKRLPALA